MSQANEALKEALQDLLRKYAFLDLQVCPAAGEFEVRDSLCVEVSCDGPGGGGVTVMARPELAVLAAGNIVGDAGATPSVCQDVVSELANIVAGHVYEILRAGHKPRCIGIPRKLSVNEARDLWEAAPEDSRLLLRSETEVVGGLLISLPQSWATWT